MKTQLIKLSVAVVAALGCMVNSAVAQPQRAVVQEQGGTQSAQGQSVQAIQGQAGIQSGSAQVRMAQPAISPMPTPRLGFMGQMLYGYGMRVLSVNYGSVASQLGLERGDVIFSINGRRVLSQFDYSQALQNAAIYQSGYLSLTVRNVRFDYGQSFQEFVNVNAFLPGYGGYYPVAGAGPVGPRSAPLQAAQGQLSVVQGGAQTQNGSMQGGRVRIQRQAGESAQIRSKVKEIARDKVPALKSGDVGSSQ